jgi:hypothetical protein
MFAVVIGLIPFRENHRAAGSRLVESAAPVLMRTTVRDRQSQFLGTFRVPQRPPPVGPHKAPRANTGWYERFRAASGSLRASLVRVGCRTCLRGRLGMHGLVRVCGGPFRPPGSITGEQLAWSEGQIKDFVANRKTANPHLSAAVGIVHQSHEIDGPCEAWPNTHDGKALIHNGLFSGRPRVDKNNKKSLPRSVISTRSATTLISCWFLRNADH